MLKVGQRNFAELEHHRADLFFVGNRAQRCDCHKLAGFWWVGGCGLACRSCLVAILVKKDPARNFERVVIMEPTTVGCSCQACNAGLKSQNGGGYWDRSLGNPLFQRGLRR